MSKSQFYIFCRAHHIVRRTPPVFYRELLQETVQCHQRLVSAYYTQTQINRAMLYTNHDVLVRRKYDTAQNHCTMQWEQQAQLMLTNPRGGSVSLRSK